MSRSIRASSLALVASLAIACGTEREVDPTVRPGDDASTGDSTSGNDTGGTVVQDSGPGISLDTAIEGGGGCRPKTCTELGANCGATTDGCGGTVECGPLTCAKAGDTCGGGGTPNVCGTTCVSKTCAELDVNCGMQGDGCNNVINCGACTVAGETCGGQVASKCGVPPAGDAGVCVAKTCADYGANCGKLGDGCGGIVDCGPLTCPTAGDSCGGGGTANVCGAPPPCVPKTCNDYPGLCGMQPDGCGKLTADCGQCTAPALCGGGGIPSVCGGGAGGCVNLECLQTTCAGTATTSISGTIYDPAGLRPLPNVFVYIPNGAIGLFVTGATCDKCADALQGYPLVSTLTDANGRFKLTNVPVKNDVPLVIQTGKWRRQVPVKTTKCVDTVLARDLGRLPKHKGEGDIPKIALTTGGFDPLECLLRKIGIADSEFTNPGGTGRINLYKGSPPTSVKLPGGVAITAATGKYTTTLNGAATFPLATTLWNSAAELKKYDVVLLACEGDEYGDPKNTYVGGRFPGTKSGTALAAMKSYVDVGGRVFASHYHNYWLRQGPGTGKDAFSTLANWNYPSPALLNSAGQYTAINEKIVMTFPKGSLLANWLKNIGGSATLGILPSVRDAKNSINSIDASRVLEWIFAENGKDSTGKVYPHSTQYMSFNTPLSATVDNQCGRFVFSDIHVSSGDSAGKDFPSGCTTTSMSPQEMALEFMLFDLSSRVCDETQPPPPPSCTPRKCADIMATCGEIADGCGGTLPCGTCTDPAQCIDNKCQVPSCTPKSCGTQGIECGLTGNGCGSIIDCSDCNAPAQCYYGKCVTVDGGACQPVGCGGRCGLQGDGCGGILPCPACDGGACIPTDCTKFGAECGTIGDGCGGTLFCGDCGGFPLRCGYNNPYKCGTAG